ncbi:MULTISPECIES: potassium-transporting ATPase subunit KdpA [Acidobacterium]|uniref:Potassium-transporting ATPase potassium-binding subunit n=1 Tax=Acidobacterium capsulatum (strain ATCC 51196 / DSM 11244 / BCRC 80197 / JCM 7670 / NBRC 15755 / NCIMB 13165 / 161) TaxID=240015 RepID=KDPA_ACIC5|nr:MULTISPECIES: potassium-transporting ATPase subunit KdpA [Acidobacterium]C1FA47.1 RecName: Full=Potassium-transporting ATPase potassium-binding subunit; AltName: Full=ATP phosphohydrolase [potassium-transporting] A chain; AltName: Full=Potassium-binding and translocating subunit A; AltName: Full=Potassium-translocating ATPase A chain [Acidobacterium capsulatum ATCC 51196]ACO31481.1 K+-transporting ATPase, A subunit [Acidobacterium capsulatum ATCC 51196]HCT62028.1 potassium-transporting ATPase
MTVNGWLQIGIFIAAVLLGAKPLGVYMAAVFERRHTWLDPVLVPVEKLLYRLTAVKAEEEMHWTAYCASMLIFSAATMLLTYLIERVQQFLPLNPQHLGGVPAQLAWNTAISFTTNTNWQAYTPESTMSYLTQMVGLATHNFWSAAVGIALAIAFIRGIARKEMKTLGNFWVDMTRAILWVLLPICVVFALVLTSQGVIQNLKSYTVAHVVQPQSQTQTVNGKTVTTTDSTQTIAQGPVASQEAIKMLGTNGGGFFNANSSHPFENPTPLSNMLEMISIFLIPAGLTVTLGQMTGSPRHGWAVLGAMLILWFAGVATCYWAEAQPNPLFHGVNQQATALQAGGNMEGKEVRFGIADSALFATVTTDASCGAVNAMHDSFMPLGGMVPLTNIMLGEIVFGGVGAGLYGMLVFVIVAVFIAGLMVGRTPEYLGNKIQAYDVQMAMLYLLIFPLIILGFSAVAVLTPHLGLPSISNPGPHGLTQILYAYSSATGNNGSAFAGLNANTSWYNLSLGFAMFIGRFLMIVPMLALAGNLAQKKNVPETLGTFPVTTPLFTVLLTSVIIVVGALTFLPALSLGPILEHLLLQAGRTF